MTSTIVNPEIPYKGEIPGKLAPGWMCRIQGVTHPEADRFNINLQTGPSSSPRDNTSLHISVRLNQGYIARNYYKNGSWGDEQGDGDLPIGPAQSWEIIILVDQNDYKIAVNGQHFCEFPFSIPIGEISYLLIDGDVSITLISWEGIAGVNSSKATELHSQTPQGFVPQQQPNYGPQGGYNAPGYGPPPPPGAEPQSGFENFMEQAQTVLAGAIKTGAAEKLLGGLLSGGQQQQQQQGYAHQNAKYGIYPDLPQDLDPNFQENKQQQQQHRPGPMESLLLNFLSGGNKQQQAQSQQIPDNTAQQPRPAVDLNSFLGNLLGGHQQQTPLQQQQQQYQQQQNVPQNQQNLDLSSLLTGLLASTGNTQQEKVVPQSNVQQQKGEQSSGGGIDLTQLLGALSGYMANATRPIEETGNPRGTKPPQQVPHQQEKGGPDIAGLLAGLLSPQNQQNQQYPQNPQQGTYPPGQEPAPPQQHQGIDLNSLLSNLLSGGGAAGQHSGPQGYQGGPQGYQGGPQGYQGGPQGYQGGPQGYQGGPQGHQGGPQIPQGGTSATQGPVNPPNQPQYQPPRQVPSGGPNKSSQPASKDEIEDVSDQLAQEIAAEGGDRSRGDQQYGQYPHPPQQQSQRGPMESMLSNFLGGGGGGGNQPSHQQQPSLGGGESIGGLGSMSGILSGLAGSLLQPRDNQNQRQNY